jgi:hypothetical protein
MRRRNRRCATLQSRCTDDGTDFNDLALTYTPEVVKWAFKDALAEAPKVDAAADIARLAALDSLAYDKERAGAAERLGCRVSTLDAEVEKARAKREEKKQTAGLCADIEPWPSPVEIAELLDDVRSTIKRFIVCDGSTATAAALWVAFTWIIDHAQVAPLAVVTAPEKRCGKSQLLKIIGKLSRRPLPASNISPSAVFRVIEAAAPTMIIDEADSFFGDNEELRVILNSGHDRDHAFVMRTEKVGEAFEPKHFSTWCAKAVAGIGRLSGTLMDRAIVLELRRKSATEKVERIRYADPATFTILARKLARFGCDHAVAIGAARPTIPEELNDRAQDNWEHLLAIADMAGGSWPNLARRAAIAISGESEDDLSLGEQLLLSIREAFEQDRADKLAREELLRRLIADEEGPWATWNKGKPIAAAQLRKRLAAFEIKTKKVRLDTYTTAQGFERRQFEDAWSRYLDCGVSSPEGGRKIGTMEHRRKSGRVSVPKPFQFLPQDRNRMARFQNRIGTGTRMERRIPRKTGNVPMFHFQRPPLARICPSKTYATTAAFRPSSVARAKKSEASCERHPFSQGSPSRWREAIALSPTRL